MSAHCQKIPELASISVVICKNQNISIIYTSHFLKYKNLKFSIEGITTLSHTAKHINLKKFTVYLLTHKRA
jgi:hypothetical protein